MINNFDIYLGELSFAINLPQPLSNDPRFIQFMYCYSHALKRFVEVYMQLSPLLKTLYSSVLLKLT